VVGSANSSTSPWTMHCLWLARLTFHKQRKMTCYSNSACTVPVEVSVNCLCSSSLVEFDARHTNIPCCQPNFFCLQCDDMSFLAKTPD
jgi:hypothetical protein